jgi:hypothetical protein
VDGRIVDGWMDGWMDGSINELMDEWFDGWMDCSIDEWMDGSMDGNTKVSIENKFPSQQNMTTLKHLSVLFVLLSNFVASLASRLIHPTHQTSASYTRKPSTHEY